MAFSKLFYRELFNQIETQLKNADFRRVPEILQKDRVSYSDFLDLITEGSEIYLEQMAQRAHKVSLSRFGKNISLYAPLYVSNECINTCTYCGFSRPNKIKRRTLGVSEVLAEAQALRSKGIRNVLILTGESPKKNPVEYLLQVVRTVRPMFDSVQIEIYPVGIEEYRAFHEAGVEGVALYQETYHHQTYDSIHLAGFKKDFAYRIDTPERASEGGIRKLSIGALLGLAPWRVEMAALAYHLSYLEKVAWRSALSLSFPRIKEAAYYNRPGHIVSDSDFVQILAAFRLFSPNSGINLSTRESATFRDCLVPLGVTAMSAGSRTDVGGYSGPAESTEQFTLEDLRDPNEVAAAIARRGYQPVFKDWDIAIGNAA